MFQTELIHFFQSFESDLLNVFFGIINSVGYDFFFIPFLLFIMFGISFRKGFYLLHVSLLTGFVTIFLKEYFALPRPYDIDLNVKLINSDFENPSKFDGMGARHFLGGLPNNVVTYFRNIKDYSHGLPSGHVSLTTALFGSISQLFQPLWVKTLAITLVVLMPITRMYLGLHFLLDVLGGLFIGVFFMLLFYYFVYKSDSIKDFFSRKKVAYSPLRFKTSVLLTYFLVVPVIFYWILPQKYFSFHGNLLGINVGFILLTIKGIPLDGGTFSQKISRILIALVLFFGTDLLLKNLGFDDIPLLKFIRSVVVSFTMIYGTTELAVKLQLYKCHDQFGKRKVIKQLHNS